jgi:hypothetical protein
MMTLRGVGRAELVILQEDVVCSPYLEHLAFNFKTNPTNPQSKTLYRTVRCKQMEHEHECVSLAGIYDSCKQPQLDSRDMSYVREAMRMEW